MVVDRCLAILARYRSDAKSPAAEREMCEAALRIAGWARDMGLGLREAESLILSPVENELFAAHGYDEARRLFSHCLRVFEDLYGETSLYRVFPGRPFP